MTSSLPPDRADHRPLPFRRRPDLVIEEQAYQGRSYWLVKDPVGLKFCRLKAEEHAILHWLDGRASLAEIKRRFQSQFAPRVIQDAELWQLIASLYRNGLVLSDAPGQGEELLRRSEDSRRRKRQAALVNVLAIRFRGIDPTWLLDRLYPWTGWFFSRTMVCVNLLFAATALLWIAVQWDTFESWLPAFGEFFGPANWLWLAVTLAVTKVLHELGHGLACRRTGGQCHEIGLMLLVLMPCLYCNTSDSWMLPDKWKRAAIGAAGMYVEIMLAALATLLWWTSEPGLFNHLCLTVMFVCSVSTIVFNGNPLLRYDGYYILSDLLEIPNLRQKASMALNRLLARVCLGRKQPPSPLLPDRGRPLFVTYAVLAIVYRWIVLLAILWFLYRVFEPYGLQPVGHIITAVALAGLILPPLVRFIRFLRQPANAGTIRRRNLAITAGVAGCLIAGVMLIPVPRRVSCSFDVQPRDARAVFISVPGRIESLAARPGRQVTAGAVLAELSNIGLELQIASLLGERAELEAQRDSLVRQRFLDARLHAELSVAEEAIAAVNEQIEDKRADRERLTIRAPIDGWILPPPRADKPSSGATLARWSGSPLDAMNRGATLRPGEMLCWIGDPEKLEAILVIDQADVDFVAEEQWARLKLDAWPTDSVLSRIEEIARTELEKTPESLATAAGGTVATRTDETGAARPLSTSYVARVPLGNVDHRHRPGMRGRALIYTGSETLARRFWRMITQTFRFGG